MEAGVKGSRHRGSTRRVLSIGLEVLLLAFILRSAWTWPRTPSPSMPDHVEPTRSRIQMGR